MKRIFIILGALLLTVGTQAQLNQHSNYIGLNVGGGMNTLRYNPADGTWSPKLGFLGELKYMHFFTKYIGLGFGVQVDMARAGASYDFREVTPNLVHPQNNLHYESRTGFFGWKESQQELVLGVPIELFLRAPMGDRWFFLFGVGAQLDFPLSGKFTADEGTYEVRGYFPATNVEYSNMPEYGFYAHNADQSGDIKNLKSMGVSVIADLGFNYAMGNHWGLYFGLYGGYGITNLIDGATSNPMLSAPNGTATVNAYNGVISSNQVDDLHLLNAGAKIGLNFGWTCSRAEAQEENTLVSYETPKVEVVEEKPEEPVKVDDQAAREAAEAATREAACKDRAGLTQAMTYIDADLSTAEQFANAAGDAQANAMLASARAKTEAAKMAYHNGMYCKAYELYNEAYADIANVYALDAKAYASRKKVEAADKAAEDAATYGEAARKGDLESAIAASRNARINAIIARDAKNAEKAEKEEVKPVAPVNNRAAVQNALGQLSGAILFDFNSSTPNISPVADAAITVLSKAMAEDKNINILITGHTDNVGDPARNKDLGMRRAEALKAVLVKRGAPAGNISTATRGEEEPVVDNETDDHRQQNRRAVVTLK